MNYFVTIKSFKMGFMSSLVLFFSISISAIDVGVAEEESEIEVIEALKNLKTEKISIELVKWVTLS